MSQSQSGNRKLKGPEHWNDVAHLLRVASLGEISSSLAHELRQPLTAILSNAQAAEAILARKTCDLGKIREILSDIVLDSSRASEVIDRLYILLKKGDFQPQPLDASELIREVLKLLNHDLVSRAVRVVTECGVGLPSIRADRVQLQQVLINLILNGVDAMDCSRSSRTLTLRSCSTGKGMVEISVSDTGRGITPGTEEKLFEPYYSTKPHGLGLGLSLSRSIVSAHGGQLWAENLCTGGAMFHCALPRWKTVSTETGASIHAVQATPQTFGPTI
jgi:two-component system, LuxR family, sensor kinase FixL